MNLLRFNSSILEGKEVYVLGIVYTDILPLHPQDIDECGRSLDNCEQNCSNTVGSFECSCRPGYQTIAGASNRCEGMYETCYFCSVVRNWRWGRPKNYSIILAYFDDVFIQIDDIWLGLVNCVEGKVLKCVGRVVLFIFQSKNKTITQDVLLFRYRWVSTGDTWLPAALHKYWGFLPV